MASKGKEFPLSIVIQTVDKATTGLRAIDAKIAKFSKNLDRIGKKTAKLGKSLTTSLTLPIVGIGIAGAKAMSDFEQGMSNVSTLIDTNTENLDDMGKSVLAIGRRTPVALEELTESLYSIRSAGIGAGDQFDVLEKSARLGVAGLGTAAEATDLVTSSLNAFQLKGAEADQVYDNIFKAVKNGKTNIAELAQGFGAVAGTVAATGTPLDEYLASVAALTTTGLPAAQAHSQLRGVMTALTKDTKETSKVFKALGAKDFKDLIAQSGGLVPALSKITDELGGNEAKILKVVGRTEAMAAIIGITGGQNKAFVDTLADMRDGANAVEVAFAKQNKTTQAQWKRTKNSLTSAAISIGKVLAPALERVAEKLQAVSAWFEGLDDNTKGWIVTIAGVAATVGPVLFIFGKVASVLGVVTTAVRVLSKVILASPIGVLAAGLAAISALTGDSMMTLFSDAIVFWKQQFREFIEWLTSKFDYLSANIDDFVSWATGKESKRDKRSKAVAKEFHEDALREEIGNRLGMAKQLIGDYRAYKGEELGAPRAPEAYTGPSFSDYWGVSGKPAMGKPAIRPGAGAKGADGKITVSFENAPVGMRVKSTAANAATNVGYQMGGE